MIQVNQPQPTAEAVLQRIMNLQQRLHDQTVVSNGLHSRSRDLAVRVEGLRRENEEAMRRVREYTEKVESLGKEAENMHILTGAFSGVATGLIVGAFVGVIGGSLALLSAKIAHLGRLAIHGFAMLRFAISPANLNIA